jgi:hypothetical protein
MHANATNLLVNNTNLTLTRVEQHHADAVANCQNISQKFNGSEDATDMGQIVDCVVVNMHKIKEGMAANEAMAWYRKNTTSQANKNTTSPASNATQADEPVADDNKDAVKTPESA